MDEKGTSCEVLNEDHGNVLVKQGFTHTTEKAHTCDTCGKCFSLASQLKAHLAVHSGETPFTCGLRREETCLLGFCEQHRCRPAFAFAQSDQRLCDSLFEKYHM